MVFAGVVTLVAFGIAGGLYLLYPEAQLVDIGGPAFWMFTAIILIGAVVENMRNIALSTTVTLLVEEDKRANANGLVGTVQGLAFLVTSVFSGLSIGFLGMGWTLAISLVLTAGALVHLLFLRIPEDEPARDPNRTGLVDLRGSIAAVRAATGLFALIVFSTFNNLIGGVYMALMDPYGLTLFPVEWWGVVLGVTATGFIIGGLVIAKWGLGRNPIRTMLVLVVAPVALGSEHAQAVGSAALMPAIGRRFSPDGLKRQQDQQKSEEPAAHARRIVGNVRRGRRDHGRAVRVWRRADALCRCYSSVSRWVSTTRLYNSSSARNWAANWSGVFRISCEPVSSMRFFTSGFSAAWRTLAATLSTTALGSPLGPTMPQ